MKPSPARFFGALVIGGALTALGLAVLAGAMLRETPGFWRNAGGFPVGLRDLVFSSFYPSLAIYFFGLVSGSFTAWQLLRARSRSGGLLLLACGLNWLLFLVILTVVLCNNIENVMNGRPLHYHAP